MQVFELFVWLQVLPIQKTNHADLKTTAESGCEKTVVHETPPNNPWYRRTMSITLNRCKNSSPSWVDFAWPQLRLECPKGTIYNAFVTNNGTSGFGVFGPRENDWPSNVFHCAMYPIFFCNIKQNGRIPTAKRPPKVEKLRCPVGFYVMEKRFQKINRTMNNVDKNDLSHDGSTGLVYLPAFGWCCVIFFLQSGW